MTHEIVYCIECEEMVSKEKILCGEGHVRIIFISGEGDLDCCEMPLGEACCPPPEAPDEPEWVKAPDEPEVPYLEREPYTVDLLEYHAQTMQEEAELLVEMIAQEV